MVAVRAGLSRTAARRYLPTLRGLGYVDTDGKLFWLAPRVLRLGQSYLDSARLPRTVDAGQNPSRWLCRHRSTTGVGHARCRGAAVPLRDRHGAVVAAISVSMPIGQESANAALHRVLPTLQETASLLRNLL
jgi:DNA-binding IclR family transcriptional regulator